MGGRRCAHLAASLNGIGLLVGLPVGYVLYHSYGIEGMAWGRLAVLATAGLATGLLAWRRMGRRIDPWAVAGPG